MLVYIKLRETLLYNRVFSRPLSCLLSLTRHCLVTQKVCGRHHNVIFHFILRLVCPSVSLGVCQTLRDLHSLYPEKSEKLWWIVSEQVGLVFFCAQVPRIRSFSYILFALLQDEGR
jgi:hypothetical protein